MSMKEQAVKNVTTTWLGLLVHAVVGFFLSPFILHRLGDDQFSLWILIFTLTGYFGLLDFGIRSAIVRYTARFLATKDEDQVARYLTTSLAFYTAVAVVVVAATGIGSRYVDLMFKIPAPLLQPARTLLLISGVGVAAAFPLGVFAGALEGIQKFWWLQLSQIGITLLRAALIIATLMHGGTLLAIGAITVAMNLLGYLLYACMALFALPIHISARQVEWPIFRKMAGYGFFAFAILAAEKLRFQTDAIVIGAFLSSTAITSFSIASRLVEYASYAVRSMSQIFTPMASHFHATGDEDRLRRTLIAGNRAAAFIIFPLCVTLLVLGKPIIAAWVGSRYVSSYSILAVLMVPRTLYLAQSTSIRILLGMARHRTLALTLLLEGTTNLLLSLLLVRRFGIAGVAWGTAIPLACTSVLFLPWHLCRVLDIPLKEFIGKAYAVPLFLCMPMGAVLLLLNREFPAHGYSGLLLQVACGGAVYATGLACMLCCNRDRDSEPWHSFAQLLEPK